jgi:ATP synthase mitochondrial F1 complex assembly factor 2
VKLQEKHWDPILHWARVTFDVKIYTSDSILLSPQPDDTKHKLDAVLAEFDHWEMAGMRSNYLFTVRFPHFSSLAMEHATTTTKSFFIALALVKGHLTVEQAACSAQVEVASQIERWGEVEDCECIHTFSNICFRY